LVALPTNTGLQFIPKADIVYIECQRSSLSLRSSWSAMLNNHQAIRLRQNAKASVILNHMGSEDFIQLSQSVIVSLAFINIIEYKTHECYLFPPFDAQPLKISRQFMAALREKFDVI
jgi:DNA-binding LytR/AlgR family response regulator